MARFLAETPRDQKMIDKLQREYEKLKNTVDRLQEENERLKKEIEEYKKHHPSTVGIKNGKSYEIKQSVQDSGESDSSRKQGAQMGRKGHYRRMPHITECTTLKASGFSCPVCSSPLVRKGIRRRVIEDIPPIDPRVTQYRI